MNSKSLPLILVSFLLVGCLGQSQPTPTPSLTPSSTPIQEKKKTSIPILSIFLAILLVNYLRKVRK